MHFIMTFKKSIEAQINWIMSFKFSINFYIQIKKVNDFLNTHHLKFSELFSKDIKRLLMIF